MCVFVCGWLFSCGWMPVQKGISESMGYEWKPATGGEKKTKCQNRAHKHRALAVTVSHLRGFELQSWGSDLTCLSYIWLAAQCTVTVV